jgi:diguanylate cyclase (GGDEF)-like protein
VPTGIDFPYTIPTYVDSDGHYALADKGQAAAAEAKRMSKKPIEKLLVVEDDPGDLRMLRKMFNEQALDNSKLTHVDRMSEAEKYLAKHAVDIIFLDLGLPDAQGLGAVRRARAAAPCIPLVVMTCLDDEPLAVQALQEGAQDYLIKGQIDTRGLMRAMRYAIERQRMQAQTALMSLQLKHSAPYDFLTDLPNRIVLADRLTQAIASAGRYRRQLAVLFVDLASFKHVNDSLGHAIGDKLLKAGGVRLLAGVRKSDTVSRQGGDEFVVVLSSIERSEDAALSATKLIAAITSPYSIDQHDLHVSVSIGISIYPTDSVEAETLIQNANNAAYHAKEKGRNNYQFFKEEMNVQAVERQSLEAGLRRALERHEFELHYQSKIDLKSGDITGVEALIRWRHPERGLVPPAEFISIAEICGLIVPIGQWVLREACTQAREWQGAGLPQISVGVNISSMEFRDKHFLENLRATLNETGLEPRHLELELTESVLMQHVESTAFMLGELRALGVQLAVDDFGTGYSSLSYLSQFPINCLKIDKSFIQEILSKHHDAPIPTAVINVGRSLRHRVIAEGVETREQLAFLQSRGCDEGQGYLFSRPVIAKQFAELLRTGAAGTVDHGFEPGAPCIPTFPYRSP